MKKLLAILLLFTISCNRNQDWENEARSRDIKCSIEHFQKDTITIEGCQYFYTNFTAGPVLTHKGNCNNPFHKNSNIQIIEK